MRSGPPPFLRLAAFAALSFASLGCQRVPGRPGPEAEVARPEQVLDFPTLYKQNCAACHGAGGRNGAALPLANPAYLAIAGRDTLIHTIANGVPGRLMPPFAKSAGGMLTTQQVKVLADGIFQAWSTPNLAAAQNSPPYLAALPGDPARGQRAFSLSCARCHGANGQGSPGDSNTGKLGSIVDASYLSLVSDQYLRSIAIGGMPDRGMPDWRSDAAQPLDDQQVTDIVSWLTSQRTASPGQPYPGKP